MSLPICSECGLVPRFCRCECPPYRTPLEGMEATIEAAQALGALRFQKFIGPAELFQLAIDDVIESAELICRTAAES